MIRQYGLIGYALVVGVSVLFISVTVQPAVATVQQDEEIVVEPKDFLFQTIVDIANNPDVKNLLEQYDNDLFKVDIERSVYHEIFYRNPRLFNSLIFTKPSMTQESLENLYNQGIKIIDIIGEDKALEIMESVKIKDKSVFEELNNIIVNDKELSKNIDNLDKLNLKISSTGIISDLRDFVCYTLLGISMGIYGVALGIAKLFGGLMDIFSAMCFNRLATFFQMTGLILASPFLFLWFITFIPAFACFYTPPPYDG